MIDKENVRVCCICRGDFTEWGNNPAPVRDEDKDGMCCDTCDAVVVLPMRLRRMTVRALQDQGRGVTTFHQPFISRVLKRPKP